MNSRSLPKIALRNLKIIKTPGNRLKIVFYYDGFLLIPLKMLSHENFNEHSKVYKEGKIDWKINKNQRWVWKLKEQI